jgi:hypothetical protein
MVLLHDDNDVLYLAQIASARDEWGNIRARNAITASNEMLEWDCVERWFIGALPKFGGSNLPAELAQRVNKKNVEAR